MGYPSAQGNSFDKVRYNDGSVYSKVDPHDRHNTLTRGIFAKIQEGQENQMEINISDSGEFKRLLQALTWRLRDSNTL